MEGLKPKELAAIAALTIIFLAFASFNMGSLEMPSSSFQPSKIVAGGPDEEIQAVFDLGDTQQEQVKEIYVFLRDANRTKF